MGQSKSDIEHIFGTGEPFSLGVEEELFLVDPVTGTQANTSAAVLKRLGPVDGQVERELHTCMIELITDVCDTAAQATESLRRLRGAVLATGAGLIGSGTHPSALEGEASITDKDRYEQICGLLGDAAATPISGMHVHVGMPDPDTAIRTFNAMRLHLPLLQALSANSPFRHRRDTGLASAREVTMAGWPRSGVPRAMRDYDDFVSMAEVLVRAADVPDYTWFWWKLRPHPRLGTVEIRALDAQASLHDAAAIVALVHCLARHSADAPPRRQSSVEVLEEGSFRAARFGVHAELPDVEGSLRPVHELLAEAISYARPYAEELGCVEQIDALPYILEHRGGAGMQRAAHEIAGMDTLLRELMKTTAAGTTPSG
jgi:carboxylate-amine ligase